MTEANSSVLPRFVFIGGVLVVALDAVYAVTSLASHISYAWFTIPQFAFYAIFAWYVAAHLGKWSSAMLVIFLTSVADATLGWGVSALIGPGRVPEPGILVYVVGVLSALIFGTAVGAISAGIAMLVRRSRA